MSSPAFIEIAKASLAASTASDSELAVFYVASARIAVTRARDELLQLETLLVARERELARAKQPKQLIMDGANAAKSVQPHGGP